jgi:adenylate cyclase
VSDLTAPASRQRLAAILAADAAGFSRLMAADEPGTMAMLDHARSIFRGQIEAHRGRVIDMAGDSVLAVFDTAAGAVGAALAVQRELGANGTKSPPEQRMQFRIGVHLGDLIEKDDGSVYGDGVNIAARLQSLAEPGGVNASDAVHCAVRHRVAARFDDLGDQQFKNIPRPVRMYRVHAEAAAGAAREAAPAHERVDKPAIAVLPFVNMSGDAEQEFFADGITEDIITELSRFRDLFVISRNSSFKYKGQPVDVRRFACELRVQYVVEGSVRKAGNRVRITVQLIDAVSDRHLWAERYDRDLQDIFAIQDEVTSTIVGILPGRVEAATHERVARETPDNLAAYECVLTAKRLHHRSNHPDNLAAQRLLERAIALDPNYAHAHAWKACVLGQTWVYGWCDDRAATEAAIMAELQTALARGDTDSDTHRILAAVYLVRHEFDRSMQHQQRALALNPNDDLIVVQHGEILTWMGEPQEGIDWVLKAMRLNPYHPERFWNHLGRAYFVARRYADAVQAFGRISTPDHTHHAFLAACRQHEGDAAAAARHAQAVLAMAPSFRVDEYLATLHYRRDADREHHRQGLLGAGLPA